MTRYRTWPYKGFGPPPKKNQNEMASAAQYDTAAGQVTVEK